jgi:hypothetical protein
MKSIKFLLALLTIALLTACTGSAGSSSTDTDGTDDTVSVDFSFTDTTKSAKLAESGIDGIQFVMAINVGDEEDFYVAEIDNGSATLTGLNPSNSYNFKLLDEFSFPKIELQVGSNSGEVSTISESLTMSGIPIDTTQTTAVASNVTSKLNPDKDLGDIVSLKTKTQAETDGILKPEEFNAGALRAMAKVISDNELGSVTTDSNGRPTAIQIITDTESAGTDREVQSTMNITFDLSTITTLQDSPLSFTNAVETTVDLVIGTTRTTVSTQTIDTTGFGTSLGDLVSETAETASTNTTVQTAIQTIATTVSNWTVDTTDIVNIETVIEAQITNITTEISTIIETTVETAVQTVKDENNLTEVTVPVVVPVVIEDVEVDNDDTGEEIPTKYTWAISKELTQAIAAVQNEESTELTENLYAKIAIEKTGNAKDIDSIISLLSTLEEVKSIDGDLSTVHAAEAKLAKVLANYILPPSGSVSSLDDGITYDNFEEIASKLQVIISSYENDSTITQSRIETVLSNIEKQLANAKAKYQADIYVEFEDTTTTFTKDAFLTEDHLRLALGVYRVSAAYAEYYVNSTGDRYTPTEYAAELPIHFTYYSSMPSTDKYYDSLTYLKAGLKDIKAVYDSTDISNTSNLLSADASEIKNLKAEVTEMEAGLTSSGYSL